MSISMTSNVYCSLESLIATAEKKRRVCVTCVRGCVGALDAMRNAMRGSRLGFRVNCAVIVWMIEWRGGDMSQSG